MELERLAHLCDFIFALTPIFLEDIIYQRKISSLTTDNFKSEDVPEDHFRNYSS